MSLMIVILGVLATFRMPTDIFPEIDIPVVSVIWSYAGISPEEMAEVVTIRCERSFTTSVNDIEHMESQSLPGLSITTFSLSSSGRGRQTGRGSL
jgi:multidrug efflux pump subunit AcrB